MAQSAAQIDTPIACDLSAIPIDQRASHAALVQSLFGGEHAIIQHADGIEVSLPSDRLGDVVSFIENERRCCRHLDRGYRDPKSSPNDRSSCRRPNANGFSDTGPYKLPPQHRFKRTRQPLGCQSISRNTACNAAGFKRWGPSLKW